MSGATITAKEYATASSRHLWEAQWLLLTGVPWKKIGGSHLADFDVTLSDKPWKSSVRVAGTGIEVPCRSVEVWSSVGDTGILRLEVPMTHVKVRSA